MYDGLDRDEAAAKSIDYCIENDILRSFLSKHRAEVKKMILSVYDEEKVMNLLKEQYREEYLEEGLSKANDLFASVINYIKEGKTKEELLKMGFPETTVDLVLSARN